METIDFHTHLYDEPNIEVQQRLSDQDVEAIATDYVERLNEHDIEHAVAIVMDEDFLHNPDAVTSLLEARDRTDRFSLVFLLDPLRDDFAELIERVVDIEALGVKLHPYLQELDFESDPGQFRDAFDRIAAASLLTIVDTNYAGEHLYEYNGVRIGNEMARRVSSPIVLAHAGNAKILDAFAVARHADNVWLDTSFTLPYWTGSSVGRDIAFCMEKLQMEQWLWGSDTPQLDPSKCRAGVQRFLREHNLDQWEAALFGGNAKTLLNRMD